MTPPSSSLCHAALCPSPGCLHGTIFVHLLTHPRMPFAYGAESRLENTQVPLASAFRSVGPGRVHGTLFTHPQMMFAIRFRGARYNDGWLDSSGPPFPQRLNLSLPAWLPCLLSR
ncbi:unnamed protein product [Calypogeia fissa]